MGPRSSPGRPGEASEARAAHQVIPAGQGEGWAPRTGLCLQPQGGELRRPADHYHMHIYLVTG